MNINLVKKAGSNLMSTFIQQSSGILILLFLIVTFLQSGLDKLFDWKGNVSFTKEHFKSSPLAKGTPFLLAIILFLEIIASLFMIMGVYSILSYGEISSTGLLGLQLSALTLIFLLIGQRLAKDYAGAMTLAVYFIITILGMMVFSKL